MYEYPETPKSALTAQAIIQEFTSRAGFDAWWDSVGPDVQIEIANEIDKIVMRYA